jgi:hypothetical protein
MTTLALILLQAAGDLPAEILRSAPRPFRARIVEEESAGGDQTVLRSGTLLVLPGRALRADFDRVRIVREGPSRDFHPLDLWMRTGEELLERFEIAREADGVLPEAVTDSAGRPLDPVRVRLGPAGRTAGGASDRAESAAELLLVPRDPRLRQRIGVVRVWADRAALRIGRVRVEEAGRIAVYTVSEIRELSPEDPAVRRE